MQQQTHLSIFLIFQSLHGEFARTRRVRDVCSLFELYVVQRLLDATSPPSKHIFLFVIQAAFLPLYVHHHIQFALYSFPVVGVKYQNRSTQNANVTIYLFYDLTRSIALVCNKQRLLECTTLFLKVYVSMPLFKNHPVYVFYTTLIGRNTASTHELPPCFQYYFD